MARLTRGAHMFFINVNGESTPKWYLVGKHIDDMSIDMNGTFEDNRNILDETYVTDEGYTPSVEATPYYADPTDDIYEFLRNLALGRKSGDDCKAEYMEVIVEDSTATSHPAWKESCLIEINSYGGDTTGFQIDYTVHPNGSRQEGKATLTSAKVPSFTAAA